MQERIIAIPVQGEGLESGTVSLDSAVVNENTLATVELSPVQPSLLGDLRDKGDLHCLMTMWLTLVRLIMILGRS